MLKPYMGYSRFAGPEEGAMLIFAHTVVEARNIGWQEGGNLFTDEYIDFAAKLLRDVPWLMLEADQDKLVKDLSHSTIDPVLCKECEMWGEQIGDDGLCDECRTEQAEAKGS